MIEGAVADDDMGWSPGAQQASSSFDSSGLSRGEDLAPPCGLDPERAPSDRLPETFVSDDAGPGRRAVAPIGCPDGVAHNRGVLLWLEVSCFEISERALR